MEAKRPSKPGKPGWPNGSAISVPSSFLTPVCPLTVLVVQCELETLQIAGLTYFAPNSPWKPL